MTSCKKCNLGEDCKTCMIAFNITEYPHFLFILFDFINYVDLLSNIEKIKKFIKEDIILGDNNKYK